MKKEFCNVKISETEKGYCFEVEGEEIKSRVKQAMESCCSKDSMKDRFRSCCSSDK
jgi:hypothetical protein